MKLFGVGPRDSLFHDLTQLDYHWITWNIVEDDRREMEKIFNLFESFFEVLQPWLSPELYKAIQEAKVKKDDTLDLEAFDLLLNGNLTEKQSTYIFNMLSDIEKTEYEIYKSFDGDLSEYLKDYYKRFPEISTSDFYDEGVEFLLKCESKKKKALKNRFKNRGKI